MTLTTLKSEISVARKRFKEFKRLPRLAEEVLGPQRLAGRGTSTDPLYDFEIDSASVTQMVKEGKTYYTMAILRENSSEDSFENLVISEDGGENEAYLIKYFPSAEYYNRLATNPHAPFVGGMSLQEIEPSSIGARIVGITCVTFTQLVCNYPNDDGVQKDHPATENCTEAYIREKSFTSCFTSSVLEEQPERFVDITPPGNGGGGGGTSGNNNPLYPSPTNPTPSNPNAPQDPGLVNPDGTGTIVSEPVIPVSMVRVLGLNLAQKAWWNDDANAEAIGIITDYLNENSVGGIYDSETKGFVKEAINALMDGGEVDFEKRIIDKITVNMPCQKQIIKDILAVSSPFTNVIKQTFNSSDNVNIRLQNGNFGVGNATTDPPTLSEVNSGSYIIDILFDNSYLQNATDLSIVAVTLHELVHAYLISLYFKGDLICENPNYGNLLTAFINFYQYNNQVTFDEYDNQQHNAMVDFMNKMANSIYNYAQSKNISVTREYCYKLACGTNTGTASFANAYNATQQNEYNNIYAHEQNGDNQAQGTPCN